MISDKTLNELEANAHAASALLSALAHPKRLLILCKLVEGECQANKLSDAVGLAPSAMAAHLLRLKALGLIAARREGKAIFYRLDSDDGRKILTTLYDIYCAPTDTFHSSKIANLNFKT